MAYRCTNPECDFETRYPIGMVPCPGYEFELVEPKSKVTEKTHDAVALDAMRANDRMGMALDYIKRQYPGIYMEALDFVNTEIGTF